MRLTRVLLVAVLLSCPAVAAAQSYTGTITGSIKDASGAVIPHATVTIIHQQTDRQETVTADLEGRYTSLPLPPGDYRVEAVLQGFRRAARTGVTVQVNSTVVIDFSLEVGDLTDAIEVRAQATLLETNSGTVGKVVDNRRILELPLNTRNVYSLIFLTPGVAGSIGNNYNSMSYSINGARPTMMDTVIDGVTASFPTVNGFTGISVFPSVDAIQEFKVLGANYPAEYGRSLGSVLNVVYKSGTNEFRGSGYEFYRNSAFDANNFFSNRSGTPLGDFNRSQFGGVLGGPIQRSRTFFMTSFEGLREKRASQMLGTVPTLLQRQGNFSQTLAQNGQQIRVFDPFSDAGQSRRRIHSRSVHGQHHPHDPDGSGRTPGAALFPVAQSAWRSGHRRAELLRHRHRGDERQQLRRPRRSPALGQPEDVRSLLVPQDVQRARSLVSGGHRDRRRTRQRAEPRAQRRHRLQPDDLEFHGDERAARLRPNAVSLR